MNLNYSIVSPIIKKYIFSSICWFMVSNTNLKENYSGKHYSVKQYVLKVLNLRVLHK